MIYLDIYVQSRLAKRPPAGLSRHHFGASAAMLHHNMARLSAAPAIDLRPKAGSPQVLRQRSLADYVPATDLKHPVAIENVLAVVRSRGQRDALQAERSKCPKQVQEIHTAFLRPLSENNNG